MEVLQLSWATASLMMSLLLQMIHGCTDRDVKFALERCNPLLSTISTLILATTDKDYSSVCWVYHQYIVCVEPHTVGCRSLLMKRYWVNKFTYSSHPYNCSIPTISNIVYKSEKKKDTVQSSGTDHNICAFSLASWATVTLTILLTLPT